MRIARGSPAACSMRYRLSTHYKLDRLKKHINRYLNEEKTCSCIPPNKRKLKNKIIKKIQNLVEILNQIKRFEKQLDLLEENDFIALITALQNVVRLTDFSTILTEKSN